MDDAVRLRSVIDDEFRAELLADSESFGAQLSPLPEKIEQLDPESLDFWTKGVAETEIYACVSTCTYGMTFMCDGETM